MYLNQSQAEHLRKEHGLEWLWGFVASFVDSNLEAEVDPKLLDWFFRNMGLIHVMELSRQIKVDAGERAGRIVAQGIQRTRRNPTETYQWLPPRQRYVGQPNIPLPAFKGKSGTFLIWDVVDPNGTPVPYEPSKPMVKNGGRYYYQGLRDLRSNDPDDLYTISLQPNLTQAEVIQAVLDGLDDYAKILQNVGPIPPVLFHGAHKLRADPYGSIRVSFGVASPGDIRRT